MATPGLSHLLQTFCRPDPSLAVEAMGIRFPSPLGLAAGFDKNALGYQALGKLGFAFVEIGTVTGQGQPGNAKPRMFRLAKDRALINRMGFNNHGAATVAARLKKRSKGGCIVGGNIGKTKQIPSEEAISDYIASTKLLAPLVDYLVINVSSPNTPGLRDLQAVSVLRPLVQAVQRTILESCDRPLPLLVKISPDLNDADIDAIVDMALEESLAGIIATNTTISRDGLRSSEFEVQSIGSGGLSGGPLKARSLEVLAKVRQRSGDKMVIISVGGIESGEEVWERIQAGANLVQAYTGFIYGGPLWPRRVHKSLQKLRTQAD